MKYKILFLLNWIAFTLLVSASLFVEILYTIYNVLGAQTLQQALQYVAIILLFVGVFLFACGLCFKRFYWLCALFISFIVYSAKLSFSGEFLRLFTNPQKVGIVVLITVCLFACTYFLHKHKKQPTFAVYLFSLGFILLPQLFFITQTLNEKSETLMPVEHPLSTVKLRETPNIYLLSYDAMVPESVVNKLLELPENPYQPTIDSHFTEFKNAYNINVPTLRALNSIMRLDQKNQPLSLDAFSGQASSILETILHANGYEITTGNSAGNSGAPGSFVDQYYTIQIDLPTFHPLLCRSKTTFHLGYNARFLGICFLPRLNEWTNAFFGFLTFQKKIKKQFSKAKQVTFDEWSDLPVQFAKKAATQKQRPQFLFLYNYHIIHHTEKNYDHYNKNDRTQFKEFFKNEGVKLNKILENIAKNIKKYDPNAIVLTFGDHGLFLYRDLLTPEEDPKKYYTDQNRVLMALLNTHQKCSQNLPKYYTKTTATPSKALLDLFICLGADKQKITPYVDFDDDAQILKHAF